MINNNNYNNNKNINNNNRQIRALCSFDYKNMYDNQSVA